MKNDLITTISALTNNNSYSIVLIWTIFVIIELYYIKIYIQNWRSRVSGSKTENMQWNIENKGLLHKKMKEEIEKRLKMLEEMKYEDWLDYNNKNTDILIGKYRYNLIIFERIKNPNANYGVEDQFILRTGKIKELLGLTYEELLKQANYTFLFSIFSPNPNLLNNIYNGSQYKEGVNIYSYFTVDENVNRPVKSNVIAGRFSKKQDGTDFNGVLYMNYSLVDVEEQYANKYYDFTSRSFLLIINTGLLFVSLILRYVVGNHDYVWLPYAFLVAGFYYLINFLDTIEGITNIQGEEVRAKQIDDGILSISFLAAVNVFIIQSIRDNKSSNHAYYEAAILFMLGLILLLMSLYKITNYNRIDEIRTHRIFKQFSYNATIYINIFILVYYSFYVIRRSTFRQQIYSSMNKIFYRK